MNRVCVASCDKGHILRKCLAVVMVDSGYPIKNPMETESSLPLKLSTRVADSVTGRLFILWKTFASGLCWNLR